MEQQIAENNKRLIRNTLTLYIRMFLAMGISFLTTRELLRAVGVEDFGLINLICGIVSLFSFLQSTLSVASSRFYNFEIANGTKERLNNIFNLSQEIYIIIAAVIFILSETVGLWIFYYAIVIPPEKINGAFWLYQYSVLAFVIGIGSISYRGLIISYEEMGILSIISISICVLKLVVVYMLYLDIFNVLAFYGFLIALVSLIEFILCLLFCRIALKIKKFSVYWDKKMFIKLFSFSGYSIFGEVAGVFSGVLVNIVLNNFFGAVSNAARALGQQISSGISAFFSNLLMAANPQIIKYWAVGNRAKSFKLIQQASKLGFMMLFFISMPVLFSMPYIIKFWLGEIPEYSVEFAYLIIIKLLIDSVSYPLITLSQATGEIKMYQTVVGLTIWLNLPVSYLVITFGFPPQSVISVAIAISIVCLIERLLILKKIAGLDVSNFVKNVIFRVSIVSLVAVAVPIALLNLTHQNPHVDFVIKSLACIACSGISILCIGLDKAERNALINKMLGFIKRISYDKN